MAVYYSGAVPGDWLFSWCPFWFLRIRAKVREVTEPGPGPTRVFDLPWYHGDKLLHFVVELKCFLIVKSIEWNIRAV